MTKRKSGLQGFFNSGLGLFVLGLVLVTIPSAAYKVWTDHKADLKEKQPEVIEAKRILTDYATRLNDLDRLIEEVEKTSDIEVKGADSILMYRIAYGAAEYRTSMPEFQNVPWATLIGRLEQFGVPDDTSDAIKATDILMNGPYVGQDSIHRGYFGPGVPETQAKTLHAYYNGAHKYIYGK